MIREPVCPAHDIWKRNRLTIPETLLATANEEVAVPNTVMLATMFTGQPKKSVCTNWTSGTLTLLTIAKIANTTTQSNPMLIPSDGSSFARRSERRSSDMATLLVIGTCRR